MIVESIHDGELRKSYDPKVRSDGLAYEALTRILQGVRALRLGSDVNTTFAEMSQSGEGTLIGKDMRYGRKMILHFTIDQYLCFVALIFVTIDLPALQKWETTRAHQGIGTRPRGKKYTRHSTKDDGIRGKSKVYRTLGYTRR